MNKTFVKRGACALFAFSALFAALAPSPARAANARACTAQELVGTWEMYMYSSSMARDANDPFFYDHQRFIFYPDGRMKTLAVKKDNPKEIVTEEDWAKADSFAPAARYTVDPGGVMTLDREGQAQKERYLCSMLLDDIAKNGRSYAKAGDVNLSYLNPSNKPVIMKAIRKVGA